MHDPRPVRRSFAGRWIVILYLGFHIGIPLAGLRAAHTRGHAIPFGWQMFSRLPAEVLEIPE